VTQRGGGAYYGTLQNCIVYYNSAGFDGKNWYWGTVINSCTTPDPGGAGNITEPPGLLSLSDPHIVSSSPCVDSGDYQSWMDVALDIDGEPRILNGTVDIGSDEFQAAAMTGAMTVAIQASYTNLAVNYGVRFQADVKGRAAGYAWHWGDGQVSSNVCVVEHAYSSVGNYEVVLNAWNNETTSSATVTIHVADVYVTYVSPQGSHTWPYTSWGTAATNIQAAIESNGRVGGMVLVTNGIYDSGGLTVYGSMANRIAITNAITVQSVNGPQYTLIVGQGPLGSNAVRCAYIGAGATLAGFTLTNGHTRITGDYSKEQSGGGVWCGAGSIVSNCTISGNSAKNYGGGVYAYYSTVESCMISGNSAGGSGGGVHADTYSTVKNCTISSNSAQSGGGTFATYSTVENCTISSNSAQSGGGTFATYSTVENCTVSDNNGGGVHSSYFGWITIRNCTISDNSGRGVHSYFVCRMTIQNCTISGNSGGGVYSGDYGTVQNTIIYFNSPWNSDGDRPSYSYCCTTPLVPGAGNITNDPGFVDADLGDYRLQQWSSCIDSGANMAWMAGAKDLEGNERIINGTVDIGAYEAGARCNVIADVRKGAPPLDVVFQAYVMEITTHDAYYWWDFDNDGTNDVEGVGAAVVTNVYSQNGLYSVALTVSNTTGEVVTAVKADYIEVGASAFVVFDKEYYNLSGNAVISVYDEDLNTDPETAQTVDIHVSSNFETNGITLTLAESTVNSGIFTSDDFGRNLGFTNGNSDVVNKLLRVANGHRVTVTYTDQSPPAARQDTVLIDATPPSTTLFSSETYSHYDGSNVYAPMSLTYSFVATDSHSAVKRIEYSINGAAFTKYHAPFALTEEGLQTLSYRALDLAGNREDTRSISIIVNEYADLAVLEATAPTNAFSGASIHLTWTVGNSGTSGTYVDRWTDRVVISSNMLYGDSDDIAMASIQHQGMLAVDGRYTAEADVQLPVGITGERWLFIEVDDTERVFEYIFETNNVYRSAFPIGVDLTPYADLVATNVSLSTNEATASEPITISWSVRNDGIAATGNGRPGGVVDAWTDRIVLSGNTTLGDADDHVVAEAPHVGMLAVDGTYDGQWTGELPGNLSGDYHVFVFSDSADAVYEYDNTLPNAALCSQTIKVHQWVIQPGTLTEDTVWSGLLKILGQVTIPSGRTLTIEPGSILSFTKASANLNVQGTLNAQGTAEQPILLTSVKDDGGPGVPAAGDWGGLIFSSSSALGILEHVDIRYAQKAIYGKVGGARVEVRNAILQKGRFGVYVYTPYVEILAENCVIASNELTGIFVRADSREVLRNCTVVGNGFKGSGWHGAGIHLGGANLTLENVILAFNRMGLHHQGDPPQLTVMHSDFYNPAGTEIIWDNDPGRPQLDRNGNITADPLFVVTAAGAYELGAESPAVDSGRGVNAPASDKAGRARHDDSGLANQGSGAPAYVDMGAFERQADTVARDLSVTSVSDPVPTDVRPGDSLTIAWKVSTSQ